MKAKKKKKVIIDTDPAIGMPFKDVDDALAILLLLSSNDVEVLGLTINFGNVAMPRAYKKAKEILRIAECAHIPVLKGAKTKNDFGKETEASQFITKMLKKYPHEITLLAIAPLTNIASVIQRETDVLRLAKEVVIMGGAVKKFPFAEFNFLKDGRSAKTVLTYPARKTLFPIDICMQATFSWSDYIRLRALRNPVTDYLSKNIFSWLLLNIPVTGGRGFYPWDIVAAAYVLDENIFSCEQFILDEKRTMWRRGLVKLRKYDEHAEGQSLTMPVKLHALEFKNLFLRSMKNF